MSYTLLTGATSDIGKAIAKTLATNQNLILSSRDASKLKDILKSLPNPKNHQILPLDLQEIPTIQGSLSCLLNGGGGIENFIHCAGESSFGAIKHFDYAQAIESFNINFFSCCEILSVLLKKPNKNNLKNVIFISSISAIRGYKGSSIYAASKAGLDSLVRSLCDELSPQVTINSITLGNISTSGNQHLNPLSPSPIGEGKCEDVSSLVCFLLSSGYLNGQNIILDGGRSIIGH